jgi:integrase/recombinase XerD
VRARQVQEWTVILLGRYSDSYANDQFRALQQFFKWYATEDPDEPRHNPMANLKPPKLGMKLVPVFTYDELAALVAACKGGGYRNRRDAAIISLFRDTGIRLSELTGLTTGDLSLREREATVTGKGDRQRTIKFTYDTARAIDRFLRERARHQDARTPTLWLGLRGPMTPSGVQQMIERRGLKAGVEVFPHKFRHTFTHVFLDRGGAEGAHGPPSRWCRLVRASHAGRPQFPGPSGRRARDRARRGPASGARDRVVREATRGGPGSLGARDPRSAARRPGPRAAAAGLPCRKNRKAAESPAA